MRMKSILSCIHSLEKEIQDSCWLVDFVFQRLDVRRTCSGKHAQVNMLRLSCTTLLDRCACRSIAQDTNSGFLDMASFPYARAWVAQTFISHLAHMRRTPALAGTRTGRCALLEGLCTEWFVYPTSYWHWDC